MSRKAPLGRLALASLVCLCGCSASTPPGDSYFLVTAYDPKAGAQLESLNGFGASCLGEDAARCPVQLFDWSATGLDYTDEEWAEAVARGLLVHGSVEARFGARTFVAGEAWIAQDATPPSGDFYLLTGGGCGAGCVARTLVNLGVRDEGEVQGSRALAQVLGYESAIIAAPKAASLVPTATYFQLHPSSSAIKNVVLLLQENHTFDSYFGDRCQGPPGVTCTSGWGCCESIWGTNPPWTAVATQASTPVELTNDTNRCSDPDHSANTELERMHLAGDHFAMDGYPAPSGDPCTTRTTAVATVRYDVGQPFGYVTLAESGALADRYFQPIAGASTSNDMVLVRAGFVHQDNNSVPNNVKGAYCAGYHTASGADAPNEEIAPYVYLREYADPTIGDWFDHFFVPFAVYMEGYDAVAGFGYGNCSPGFGYPYGWDPADNPFNYYPKFRDDPTYARDYGSLESDLALHRLPRFALVRSLGINSEHPGSVIQDGVNFVNDTAKKILEDPYYGPRTLVLVSWDEGGGFYDHISPPLTMADGTPLPKASVESPSATSTDGVPRPGTTDEPECYRCLAAPEEGGQEYYGTRVPLIALGPFVTPGTISHVVMEHASVVKFLEWNFLAGHTGQLGTRDLHVNNLGSLLAPGLAPAR